MLLEGRSIGSIGLKIGLFPCVLHKFLYDFGPNPIDFGSQPDRESCNFGYVFLSKIDFLQSVDRVDRVGDRVHPIVGRYTLHNKK